MIEQKSSIKKYKDHYPVMLHEMLDNLAIKDGGKYLDCTFGAGGYSRAILDRANCGVVSLDQDPSVKKFATEISDEYSDRFKFIQANFTNAIDHLDGEKFDGIVLDLGVSSMQIDIGDRGFSFQKDGNLDMRMSIDGQTAADFINNATESEIADVIYQYGEETKSRKIAKYIVNQREIGPITTTLELAQLVKNAKRGVRGKIDPATKTFQAIRIFINGELESLVTFLSTVKDLLKVGGRLVIVSFHSLEDKIVKNFFKDNTTPKVARSKYAKEFGEIQPGKWLKVITKKPLEPQESEIKENIRSRSAKMRVAEKLGGSDVS